MRAWGGPFRGTETILGEEFQSYIPTPPFAEYVSGHSTFSAASAEILRRFTSSDRFGASVTIAAGSSGIEPGLVPAADVVLAWRTFSDAADQAGLSRRYGGIHFESGDLEGSRTRPPRGAQGVGEGRALFLDAIGVLFSRPKAMTPARAPIAKVIASAASAGGVLPKPGFPL